MPMRTVQYVADRQHVVQHQCRRMLAVGIDSALLPGGHEHVFRCCAQKEIVDGAAVHEVRIRLVEYANEASLKQ